MPQTIIIHLWSYNCYNRIPQPPQLCQVGKGKDSGIATAVIRSRGARGRRRPAVPGSSVEISGNPMVLWVVDGGFMLIQFRTSQSRILLLKMV